MGRRKIAIRAIKDDRNRSVTFLKRKGGLFKKAHELSVLCSVDVAVIIFGQNKKLYEFSSGDIRQTVSRYQYYGPPHEHKGPADFTDKGGTGDDDDEDDDNAPPSPQPNEQSPPHHGVPLPIQSQPGMQHMREPRAPSASQSPPMPNGSFQPHRLSTPQPGGISRPDSRTHIRRTSSNLAPQHHSHPQASQMMNHPQMQYGYHQPQQQHQQHHPHQASFYQQQQQQQQHMQGHPQQHTPPMQHQQQHHHHQQQQQQHHFTTQAPHNAHMQPMYMPDQHRTSLPPHMHHEGAPMASMHPSPPPSRPFQSPPLPGGPGPTQPPPHRPDAGGYHRESVPQQHWHPSAAATMPVRSDHHHHEDTGPARPQSIDVGAAMRYNVNEQPPAGRYGPPPAPPPSAPLQPPPRTSSTSGSAPTPAPAPPPPVRVNSMASDAKRPQLKVTIPGGDDSGTADSPSPKDTNKTSTTTPAKPGVSETSHSSSLVLPAPSPRSASAGAILSAGATGPTNPFARPNLPKKEGGNTDWGKDGIASPMSALPSRVMAESGYMSSPSGMSMFPDLGFGSMHGNTLASPAVYQPTPINYHGPSFRDDPVEKKEDKDKDKEKRPRSGEDAEDGPSKKPKT